MKNVDCGAVGKITEVDFKAKLYLNYILNYLQWESFPRFYFRPLQYFPDLTIRILIFFL